MIFKNQKANDFALVYAIERSLTDLSLLVHFRKRKTELKFEAKNNYEQTTLRKVAQFILRESKLVWE